MKKKYHLPIGLPKNSEFTSIHAEHKAIEDYSFDCGMFEYEFNLAYDNKLELSDLTFTDAYDLVEAIVSKVEKQFKIEEDETNE